ncbi:MAG: LysR family transcriptional regulator [Oscillospiraceae bacterium]|nr:LysR family transcriptional regulator [Oscillospiraceae bacterium]
MELTQLRYFVQVAEAQSLSQASQVLHVSQPALSKTIHKLEEELNTPLFDRIGNRIFLNEKGKIFLTGAQKVLNHLYATTTIVTGLSEQNFGKLSIGVFVSHSLILEPLKLFAESNPKVQISINCQNELSENTDVSAFDMIICPDNGAAPQCNGIPILEEKMALFLPADHPLASRGSVRLHEIKEEPFILLNSTKRVYDATIRLCQQAGFMPHIRFTTTSTISQKQLIAEGMAIGFAPEGNVSEYLTDSRVKLVNIEDIIKSQTILMCCKKNAHLSEIAKSFRNFMFEYFDIPLNNEHLQTFETS